MNKFFSTFDIQNKQGFSFQKGVTLLELLISIAIISILLTSVGPNIKSILVSNRITSDINQLSSIMRFARHTAVNEQISTIVCPTNDYLGCDNDWTLGKMVFVDLDGNGDFNGDEEVAAAVEALPSTVDIFGVAGTLGFNPDGSLNPQVAQTITVCDQDGEAKYARALLVAAFGRITLSNDGNGDGIHENETGTPLSCS